MTTIRDANGAAPRTLPAARFLHESDLLFKINRDVLHPLGLALAIVQDDDGSFRMSEELLDCRQDGICFSEDSVARGEEKLRRFHQQDTPSQEG